MPDNPSTFMTKISQRSANNSPVNKERYHVLNPAVNWDGSIDSFEGNNSEGHYGQSGTVYQLILIFKPHT
jgi:hypothetical protein